MVLSPGSGCKQDVTKKKIASPYATRMAYRCGKPALFQEEAHGEGHPAPNPLCERAFGVSPSAPPACGDCSPCVHVADSDPVRARKAQPTLLLAARKGLEFPNDQGFPTTELGNDVLQSNNSIILKAETQQNPTSHLPRTRPLGISLQDTSHHLPSAVSPLTALLLP